ncbi:MAG: RNA methyltransferase [Bacteroidales bacterium]
MLSKNKIKLIRSLHILKFRRQLGLFIAEGPKIVREVLNSHYTIDSIFATCEWFEQNSAVDLPVKREIISESELKKISNLKTPNEVLAIVKIPMPPQLPDVSKHIVLMLDEIKDPGNLGTIIRMADWFGIEHIICSDSCVDVFNPKVVQSAMGSVFRVQVFYTDLIKYLRSLTPGLPVYGTFTEGSNIFLADLVNHGVIIIGSESHGISRSLLPFISNRLSIPNFAGSTSAESLNASIAAAITIAEFRRRELVSG